MEIWIFEQDSNGCGEDGVLGYFSDKPSIGYLQACWPRYEDDQEDPLPDDVLQSLLDNGGAVKLGWAYSYTLEKVSVIDNSKS